MSYDLRIWSSDALRKETWLTAFPEATSSGDLVLEGANWIVRFAGSREVEREDIPDKIAERMPQIRLVAEITVEPIDAPASVLRRVRAACKIIVNEAGAVVEDPQTEELIFPSGVRRASALQAPKATTVSLVTLSYWCTLEPLSTRQGRAALTDYFSAHLPEALPRRYGSYEPLEGKWANGGNDAFLDYLDAHGSGVIQAGTRPVTDVSYGLRRRFGWDDGEFRCGDLSITLELTALDDDERRTTLARIWRDLVELSGAIAAIVTIADGWTMSRNGALSITAEASRAQSETGTTVHNTIWYGIPRRLGMAFGLREEFARHWPMLISNGERENGFVFADTGDWRKRKSVNTMLGDPPDAYSERPGRFRAPLFFYPEPTAEQVQEQDLWTRRWDLLREEQAPILDELASVGITVTSLDKLYTWEKTDSYALVVPIMLRHLKRSYSDVTAAAIARVLDVSAARRHWPDIVAAYRAARVGLAPRFPGQARESRPLAKDALGRVVASKAGRKRLTNLIELARDTSLGESRFWIVRALRRSKHTTALNALRSLADDPDLAGVIASYKLSTGEAPTSD